MVIPLDLKIIKFVLVDEFYDIQDVLKGQSSKITKENNGLVKVIKFVPRSDHGH